MSVCLKTVLTLRVFTLIMLHAFLVRCSCAVTNVLEIVDGVRAISSDVRSSSVTPLVS